jgi:hypothetical protein
MSSKRDWSIIHYGARRQPNGSYMLASGTIQWYNDEGRSHREDGPAVILRDGTLGWFCHGTRFSFSLWCRRLNIPDEQKVLLRLQYD